MFEEYFKFAGNKIIKDELTNDVFSHKNLAFFVPHLYLEICKQLPAKESYFLHRKIGFTKHRKLKQRIPVKMS